MPYQPAANACGRHFQPQHRQAERLGNIIVGARLIPHDLVYLLIHRRQEYNMHAALFPHFPHKIQPIAIRKRNITKDELYLLTQEHSLCLRDGITGIYLIAVFLQNKCDSPVNSLIIFH